MARMKNEINAGSMADIAFLLLIFFLVTTTMDVDSGIMRKLPPPIDPKVKPEDIIKRNIFEVLVNSADMLLVNKAPGNIATLKDEAKDFLTPHPEDNPNYPQTKEKFIEGLGTVYVSKGVISLQNDRGTSYNMYMQVQNELTAAIRELRDEFSVKRFGVKFNQLDEERSKAVQAAIPMSISEAEPKDVGGLKK